MSDFSQNLARDRTHELEAFYFLIRNVNDFFFSLGIVFVFFNDMAMQGRIPSSL